MDAAKERVLAEANEKAREILQEAKDYADETIRKINKYSVNGAGRELEAERSALRERIGDRSSALQVKQKKKKTRSLNYTFV